MLHFWQTSKNFNLSWAAFLNFPAREDVELWLSLNVWLLSAKKCCWSLGISLGWLNVPILDLNSGNVSEDLKRDKNAAFSFCVCVCVIYW